MSRYNFTKKDVEQWIAAQGKRNPKTGRAIKKNGPLYRKLEKEYMKQFCKVEFPKNEDVQVVAAKAKTASKPKPKPKPKPKAAAAKPKAAAAKPKAAKKTYFNFRKSDDPAMSKVVAEKEYESVKNLPIYDLLKIGAMYMSKRITKEKAKGLIEAGFAGKKLTFNGKNVEEWIRAPDVSSFTLIYDVVEQSLITLDGYYKGDYIELDERVEDYTQNDILILYEA